MLYITNKRIKLMIHRKTQKSFKEVNIKCVFMSLKEYYCNEYIKKNTIDSEQ